MSTCEFIDTFPAFLAYWAKVQDKPLDDQIEGWATEYMSAWPELLSKQIEEYSSQNLDWRQIARGKVFPYLTERLSAMRQARQNLLELGKPLFSRAQQVLAFDSNAVFVIYVGIGCGAGWVTTFGGSPAILFGLENIAECGWSTPKAIMGLVAHEIGHLVHHYWRTQHGKSTGRGPWWQLYEEGFAQRCEELIKDSGTWHQMSSDDDWLDWCKSHKGWLAAKFLRTVDAGEPVSAFFGSWLKICGKSETGYFLGCGCMKELEKRFTLQEIALLENVEVHLRPILEQMMETSD
ncbi:MAG: hypothetical protein D6704_08635 [Nitrospirae bacterium]|nr:MAG: hypothetical protein D6704_08635 [Nitrospirota bacterium]